MDVERRKQEDREKKGVMRSIEKRSTRSGSIDMVLRLSSGSVAYILKRPKKVWM